MRVLVTGCRKWEIFDFADKILGKIVTKNGMGTVLIHGDCEGVDRSFAQSAKILGIEQVSFPVTREEWKTVGISAGPKRNQRMVSEGKPDICLAFHQDFVNSKGARDCVLRCLKAKVTTRLFDSLDGSFRGAFLDNLNQIRLTEERKWLPGYPLKEVKGIPEGTEVPVLVFISPDGRLIVDSTVETDEQAYWLFLGFPGKEEIEEAKANGARIVRTTIKV